MCKEHISQQNKINLLQKKRQGKKKLIKEQFFVNKGTHLKDIDIV